MAGTVCMACFAHAEPPPAQTWLYRSVSLGTLHRYSARETWRLTLTGNAATLEHWVEEGRNVHLPDELDRLPWVVDSVARHMGVLRKQGKLSFLVLRKKMDDGRELKEEEQVEETHLYCTHTNLDVHALGARLVSGGPGCENSAGKWIPAALRGVQGLYCNFGKADEISDFDRKRMASIAQGKLLEDNGLFFVRKPGVEWLNVNSDCLLQTTGYRLLTTEARPPERSDPIEKRVFRRSVRRRPQNPFD